MEVRKFHKDSQVASISFVELMSVCLRVCVPEKVTKTLIALECHPHRQTPTDNHIHLLINAMHVLCFMFVH